ncbi:MAG: hypothetical protein GF417_13155 [Candidatus Latescibacteria bacterium]|nr:hypothetical protein [bacterium]MBD3425375.1 hypothetical protein [Candidatus Latescibacterota bacterium]
MKKRGHDTVEHTADMGVKGWGPDIESAFEEAAAAMFGLMADTEECDVEFTIQVSCEAESVEELLVEFLNSLLTGLDLEDALGISVDLSPLRHREGVYYLAAVAHCVSISSAGGKMRGEVKAATSYGAGVESSENGIWEAVCVVDM